MANPRKRHHRKRKQNPSHAHGYRSKRRYYASNPRVSHRRYRRKRNPRFDSALMKLATYGAVGAVGTRMLTQLVLQEKNAGALGYAGNVGVAYGLSLIGDAALGEAAGTGLLVGGLIATVLRIAKEQLFASGPLASQLALSGLGDADFALKGYTTDPFLLPTTSDGQDQMTRFPAIPAWTPPPAPAGHTKGLQGYYSQSAATIGPGAIVDRYNPTWG